jgi:hypothetical protein
MSKLWEIIRGFARRRSVLIPNANELIEDRIKFQFYAADKHMDYVKELEAKGENFDGFSSRLKYEIEIEDLLSHLIGSLDALLFRIDKKLSLVLPPKKVRFKEVSDKLDSMGRQDILLNWTKLRDPAIYPLRSWLTILIDIRNTGTHINLINKRVEVEIGKPGPNRVCFAADPDSTLEIIPYLEDRIQKVRDLVESIMQKEPSLRTV